MTEKEYDNLIQALGPVQTEESINKLSALQARVKGSKAGRVLASVLQALKAARDRAAEKGKNRQ